MISTDVQLKIGPRGNVITSPDYIVVDKADLSSEPWHHVVHDLYYLDTIPPRLYELVGGDDKSAELRRRRV